MLLRDGKSVVQDTVGWDEVRQVTVSQRSKEEAHDYRYFPEPDLPPLQVSSEWVEEIRTSLPELPSAKRERFISEYGLSPYAAGVLTADRPVADYFEKTVEAANGTSPVKIANWLSSDLFGLLNEAGVDIVDAKVTPEALADLVQLVERGQISAASGKTVLEELFQNGGKPADIVEKQGLAQMVDLRPVIDQVLADNPDEVSQYQAGKTALFEWFVGQVMRATQGRADPAALRSEMESALSDLENTGA